MQAEDLVFTKKYKEIAGPRIITDLAVEFTPFVAGKSKPLVAPKTQKSRQIAEIPAMISNQPCLPDRQANSVILDTVWGAVVKDVRTVFERLDDTSIYIPTFPASATQLPNLSGSF